MTRQERVKPARAALETKVILMEGWVVAERIPSDTPVLQNIKNVQEWTDATQGLTTWKSFSVAAPGGSNGDLRVRLDLALSSLQRIRDGNCKNGRKKPRRGRAISQIQTEQERNRLAEQNVDLLAERNALKAEVARLGQLLTDRDDQHRELLAKLEKIAPFGRR